MLVKFALLPCIGVRPDFIVFASQSFDGLKSMK